MHAHMAHTHVRPHMIFLYFQVMTIVKATSVLISPDVLGDCQPLELNKIVLIPDDTYGLVTIYMSCVSIQYHNCLWLFSTAI